MRRIAVLLDSGLGLNRKILAGIARYAAKKPDWELRPELVSIAWVPDWRLKGLDAAIGRPRTTQQLELLQKLDCPCFFYWASMSAGLKDAGAIPLPDFCSITAAELAAGHLFERGLRQFVFVDHPVIGDWGRAPYFQQALEKRGCHCLHYQWPHDHDVEEKQKSSLENLSQFLLTCPRPLGVLAANDQAASFAVDACRRAGLRVPEEVAVMGIDNDEFLCELSRPPLTSVVAPGEQMGYMGARIVDRYLSGKPISPSRQIKPRHVAVRRSTDIVGVNDPALARALRYMRDHALEGLTVAELVEQTKVSRRMLEMKIADQLQTTLGAEITRLRIEAACRMIQEDKGTFKQISGLCGYPNVSRFNEAFHRVTNQTPGEYRRRWLQWKGM